MNYSIGGTLWCGFRQDVASYSMANAANNLMQSVGVSMLSKTLDSQEMQGDALAKMMEMSVNPNVGANIDIRL